MPVPNSTRVSVMWKKLSTINVSVVEIPRTSDLLTDIRLSLPEHPISGSVYWRDDIFDPEVFHAHRQTRYPFEKLGESIGTAYVIKDNKQ